MMVDYTNLRHLLNNTILTQQAALTDETKAAFVKYKELFLSQLKIGDLIEGSIIKTSDLEFILQLKEGLQLPVQFEGNTILNKPMTFIVQNIIEGSIYLKPYVEETSIQDKAIQTFKLPENLEMKSCIEAFVAKELPLDRQMLLKSYGLHKQVAIPYPVLTNIIEKMGTEAGTLFTALSTYRSEQLTQGIERFKSIMMEQGSLSKTEWIGNQVKLMETLLARYGKEDVEVLWRQIERQNSISSISFNEVEKEGISQLIKNTTVNTTFEFVLKGLLEQPDRLIRFNEKLYDNLFTFSKAKLRGMEKNLKLFKESPLFESYNQLGNCLKATEEMTLSKEIKQVLQEIQEPLTYWNKLQSDGQYFIYPFEVDSNKEDAVVYFYKPKKKSSKNKKDYFAVVALDMPYLNKLEVHIHQIEKQLVVDFFVEEKSIVKFIEGNFTALQDKLIPLGYSISKWSCQLKVKEHESKLGGWENGMTGLDLKV